MAMKISPTMLCKLSALMIVCGFAVASPINAQRVITNSERKGSSEPARLIVNRAADFGIADSVNLFVDGSKVAVIGYNASYDAPLVPGKHVLSVTTNPWPPETMPKQLVITAEPGKAYTFTADWPDSETAGLVQD
jgi:hypothetical protein